MAHSDDTKAHALAQLMLGNSPRHVAEQLGLPLTTVKRWRKDVPSAWDTVLGEEGRAVIDEALSDVAEIFPGLLKR